MMKYSRLLHVLQAWKYGPVFRITPGSIFIIIQYAAIEKTAGRDPYKVNLLS